MEMNYVAPEMEVLEVMVEAGFEGSSNINVNVPSSGEDVAI